MRLESLGRTRAARFSAPGWESVGHAFLITLSSEPCPWGFVFLEARKVVAICRLDQSAPLSGIKRSCRIFARSN